MIVSEGLQGGNQRTGLSRRAKLHVDLVSDSFFGRGGQIGDELLSQADVKFVGGQAAARAALTSRIVRRVIHKDQVQV